MKQNIVNLVSFESNYFNALLGHFVQSFALLFKNLNVGLQQVFSFHAFPAGHSTDQDGDIDVLEGSIDISSGNNLWKQQISASTFTFELCILHTRNVESFRIYIAK